MSNKQPNKLSNSHTSQVPLQEGQNIPLPPPQSLVNPGRATSPETTNVSPAEIKAHTVPAPPPMSLVVSSDAGQSVQPSSGQVAPMHPAPTTAPAQTNAPKDSN